MIELAIAKELVLEVKELMFDASIDEFDECWP